MPQPVPLSLTLNTSQKIRVSPKDDTEHTWIWHIKDTDRRDVPLTDEVVKLLAEHQTAQPEGYPYIFVTN
jgi:hypothetical protein